MEKTIIKQDVVSIADLSAKELWIILKFAKELKDELKKTGKNKPILHNKTLAMIFEKPSLRTRISFETGTTQLGGHALFISPSDIGIKNTKWERESVSDSAQVISTMVDLIMARTYKHSTVKELAYSSQVPVINGLTDLEHPCQILADILTIWEIKGKLKGLTICYIGDGENNVTHSLCLVSALLGVNFISASPPGFGMNSKIMEKAQLIAAKNKSWIKQIISPQEAVNNADVVVTDTWISMGDEDEKANRIAIFQPYQVNNKLMSAAKKDALFMHCLPAYRDHEVASEVIDGPQSVVIQEAENRLHAQKALMCYLLHKIN